MTTWGSGCGAARRRLEEAVLRRLRELGSRSGNRRCCECGQRGPTYIDITAGSFVCTACSGLLRGLNPPHRVKSISMTTFTEQEIEFLQAHGNEVCRQMWLGLFDSRSASLPDYRDPQKIKEFLQDKYEKKRWYVPPERGQAGTVNAAPPASSSHSTTPDIKPLRSLMGESVLPITVGKSSVQAVAQPTVRSSQVDLLADIGGDPFATATPHHPQPTPGYTAQQTGNVPLPTFNAFPGGYTAGHQTSFQPSGASGGANFANFEAFPRTGVSGFGAFGGLQTPTPVPPSHADKYAALADLESIFKAPNPVTGSNPATEYSAVFGAGVNTGSVPAGSVFSMSRNQVPPEQTVTSSTANFGAFSNPFTTPSMNAPPVSTNPFQTNGMTTAPVFGVTQATAGYTGGYPQQQYAPQQSFQQQNGSGFDNFGQPKGGSRFMVPTGQTAISSNPFMPPPATNQFRSGTSTNPFL
uniref:HIV-1 Rev-binding protein n=1 Tax=Callorhinchus milii TaxID=7868 RepID=V9KV31_CALMI